MFFTNIQYFSGRMISRLNNIKGGVPWGEPIGLADGKTENYTGHINRTAVYCIIHYYNNNIKIFVHNNLWKFFTRFSVRLSCNPVERTNAPGRVYTVRVKVENPSRHVLTSRNKFQQTPSVKIGFDRFKLVSTRTLNAGNSF